MNDLKNFNEFIWACENVLDNASLDAIEWKPNLDRSSWEKDSFYHHKYMNLGAEIWSKIHPDIYNNSHISKQILEQIIFLEQNEKIIKLINFKINALVKKIIDFEAKYKMFHVDIMPKNQWFYNLYIEVINYQSWLNDRNKLLNGNLTISLQNTESKTDKLNNNATEKVNIKVITYTFLDWERGVPMENLSYGKELFEDIKTKERYYRNISEKDYKLINEEKKKLYWESVERIYNGLLHDFNIRLSNENDKKYCIEKEIQLIEAMFEPEKYRHKHLKLIDMNPYIQSFPMMYQNIIKENRDYSFVENYPILYSPLYTPTDLIFKAEAYYKLLKWLYISKDLQIPQSDINTEQDTPSFTNNFDNIKPTEIYTHFKASLVEKGYLTEQELNQYLKAAFELKIIPEILFKLKHTPTKQKIYNVFYIYYREIAQKKHERQKEYAALLGNYFEGYKTEIIQTNWAREYKIKR